MEKRLLPHDYQRKIKYDSLDDTPKKLGRSNRLALFHFPDEHKGQRFKDREFLVFYFDDEEDYRLVRSYFEVPRKARLSHPELDTAKLVELVRRQVNPSAGEH